MASKARLIMAFYGARYVGKWDKNLRFIARGARSKGYKMVSIAQCTQKLLIISQFGSLSAFSLKKNCKSSFGRCLMHIYALSFYVTKTVLVGPKWFWSDQIDLDLTIMIWS